MAQIMLRAFRLARPTLHRAILISVVAVWSVSLAQAGIRPKARRPAAPTNPRKEGKWVTGFNWGTLVHANVLPNGKVLYWSQFAFPPTYTRLWCGVVDNVNCFDTTMPEPVYYDDTYLFCSGHSLLPDGRLIVSGGTMFEQNFDGTRKTTLFDPATNAFANGPAMEHGRWYPSNVTLGNGETLMASGTYCSNHLGPRNPFCFSGYVVNNIPDVLNSSGTALRSLTGATVQLPLYPWLHLASDGRVFYSGPNSPARWLDTAGTGAWSATERPYYYSQPHDPPEPKPLISDRDSGSAVMYDTDKVLIAGGANPPTPTAEIINLTNEGSWMKTGSMHFPRRHLNLTILADGQVLATGGSSGDGFNNTCPGSGVKEAEMWDPENGTWTTMAALTHARFYHSTALLLVDGRVLVGGSTPWNPEGDPCRVEAEGENEIFSPPYLFNSDGTAATRPTISSAPTSVGYGQQFLVNTPNGPSIDKVTMVRLSSVTHSINMNQRINRLTFQHVGAGVRIDTPANGNVCPPGHYMLFLINSSGVPSVAKVVQIS